MNICPNCKSNNVALYILISRWRINKCSDCELVYTLIEDNIKNINNTVYNTEYIRGYRSREIELRVRFREYLHVIEKYQRGGKLLDIGCGMGYFIAIAEQSSNYIWKTTGVELNTQLIKAANKLVRKRIVNGSLSRLPFKSNVFDCVTCFDVLEHDQYLQKNLSEVKRVLKKGGILVVQAPNYVSLMAFLTGKKWDWWALPDHVLHMSFAFLDSFLLKNNFEILQKFTYERSKDFLLNIKGTLGKSYIQKIIFYSSVPVLFLFERISWLFNLGALSFVIARKKV